MIKHSYLLPLSLFALFTAPFLFAAPSNALMHDYETIPAVQSTYVTKSGTYRFQYLSILSLDLISPRQRPTDTYALTSFNSNNYTCSGRTYNGRNYGRLFSTEGGYRLDASADSIVSVFPSNENNFTDYCLIQSPFGQSFNVLNDITLHSSMPGYTGEFPLYNGYLLPYDHIYLSNSLNIDGVVKNFNLRSADLTNDGSSIHSVNEIIIPFDEWNDNIGGRLTNGRHLEYRGQIYFKNGANKVFELLGSNAFGRVSLDYIDHSVNGNGSGALKHIYGSACTFSHYTGEEDYWIDYSCPIDVDVDFGGSAVIQPYLRFNAGTGCTDGCYLWKFTDDNVDWFFNSTVVITDYDETPGPVISDPCFGSECDQAPGAGSDQIDQGSDDWFSSLVGMFRFNALNPFQPIFNMFNNPSGCVNIPIIAGMLNSNETTYCTWFPTSVRSVLTPVLSMASVMLVFGFFVRWLGSSSGNFFEDSKGEEISNVNHSGWKRYKK